MPHLGVGKKKEKGHENMIILSILHRMKNKYGDRMNQGNLYAL